jgi:CubicO group peptidase (beta-lactamase class C family)
MKRKICIFFLMIILFGLGFSQEKIAEDEIIRPHFRFSPEEVFENQIREPYSWPASTPEEQGLDSSIFESAFQEAEKIPYIYSLLVVRNGYLIAERYFHLQDKYDANNVYSVSKSFASALVGIAFRENYLYSLDQKLMDFFPEYITADLDPRKFDITIEHLLTMKAGFDFDENQEDWDQYWTSADWIRYAIELPLRHNPGESFHYSTVQTNLLSGILTKTAGMSTREFAEKYLFTPLNISIRSWHQDPQGIYTGGHEMYYTPRDMARFGYLYLKNGLLDGKQIVPEAWVKQSIKPSSRLTSDWGPMTERGYGYKWWLGKIHDYELYHASGMGGQYIMNIPELNMVIVTTMAWSSWPNPGQFMPIELIANHILLPIKCFLGFPPHFPSEVSAEKVENRGLGYFEYINVLRWQPNPRNAGVNISKYRIYQVVDASIWFLLDEVNASTFEYWDLGVDKERKYTYGISSVTDDDKESVTAIVTVQHPINR